MTIIASQLKQLNPSPIVASPVVSGATGQAGVTDQLDLQDQ